MSKDSDLFSVVMLGSMNPRIHHPKWYQSVGIFSDEEVEYSIGTQPVFCTPAFSQFVVGDLVIKCLPERWDIQTTKPENIDKIREIGQRLFDVLLCHTPVKVVALNFDYVREKTRGNTRDFLAGILSDAAAKLGMGAADGGDLILKRSLESIPEVQRTATIALRSTDSPETFSLACNYNYLVKFDGLYEIGGFLPEYAREDRADAEGALGRIVTALDRGANA